MTIKDLIKKLEDLGSPDANVVLVGGCYGDLICITDAKGLLADPMGDLYTVLETDEPIKVKG